MRNLMPFSRSIRIENVYDSSILNSVRREISNNFVLNQHKFGVFARQLQSIRTFNFTKANNEYQVDRTLLLIDLDI